jgi:nicotinate-nucleotide adenylyltransferase
LKTKKGVIDLIVIFGGSFNPPHIAHKIIAEIAYDKIKPEKFFIIPSPIPPHKKNFNFDNFDKRVSWCKKTFDLSRFEVSTIENELSKPSYSFNTIKYFYEFQKDIILLIGTDMLDIFEKWYNYNEILNMVSLLVYPRFGDFNSKKSFNYNFLDSPLMNISSSLIRERIIFKKTVRGMIVDSIYDEVYSYFSSTKAF